MSTNSNQNIPSQTGNNAQPVKEPEANFDSRVATARTENAQLEAAEHTKAKNENPNIDPNTQSSVECYAQDFFYPGISYSFEPTKAILIEETRGVAGVAYRDQWGYDLAQYNTDNVAHRKKLYVSATVEDAFIYNDPVNLQDARAILEISTPVNINTPDALGPESNKNPDTFIVPIIASEDHAIMTRLFKGTLPKTPQDSVNGAIPALLAPMLVRLFSQVLDQYTAAKAQYLNRQNQTNGDAAGSNFNATAAVTEAGNSPLPQPPPKTLEEQITWDLEHTKNSQMAPKAAIPGFAAVPLESNQHVYGPWVDYPDRQKDSIFPYLFTNENRRRAIENMIGLTDVEINSEFAPWNYNGMVMLDQIADLHLQDKATYQQSLETGQLTVPGYPAFMLGDELRLNGSTINSFQPVLREFGGRNGVAIVRNKEYLSMNAPTITNIQIQIGNQTDTTYSFRTYTSKLSLYNKENAERIKKFVGETRKRQRDQHNLSLAVYDRMQKKNNLTFNSTFRDLIYQSKNSKFSATSPVEIMSGSFTPFKGELKATGLPTRDTKIDMLRSRIGIYETKEIPKELDSGYSSKAFMSLDGFFSPVSFYPTPFFATKHYTKYDRNHCPICNSTGKYEIQDYSQADNTKKIAKICDYCEIKTETPISASPTSSSPPFILTSGIRLAVRSPTNNQPSNTILYEYVTDKNVIANPKKYYESFGKRGVNLYSLNPIIVPTGEFRNNNAGSKDFGTHSIEVVGRGMIPPKNSLKIIDNAISGEVQYGAAGAPNNIADNKKIYKYNKQSNKFEVDASASGIIPKDFCDIDYELTRTVVSVGKNTGYSTSLNGGPKYRPMNQRFFGLRGPLVLHAWGYDLDGFPVPNASGDPINDSSNGFVPDQYGRPWRTTNINTRGSNDPSNTDCGDIVIGKNQKWNTTNNSWSAPYKEMEFSKEWGKHPETWPVGPIDLRWDNDRKVWTTPLPPKDVYVILEEDLIMEQNSRNSYPARGFIDDYEFSKDPLPDGLRRVVFVKDRSGYTAPRGAKLYCRYNGDTGFYEPISKPNIIASGIIRAGYQATIFNSFSQPNYGRSNNVTQINITFVNNLNIEVKPSHRALFIYMDGAWNIMSIGRP